MRNERIFICIKLALLIPLLLLTIYPVNAAAPSAKVPDTKKHIEITKPVKKVIKKKPTTYPAIHKNISFSEQDAFRELVRRESGGNPLAVNKTSLACGIGQFLPCKKLLDKANINYNAANLTSVSGVKKELAKVPLAVQEQLMWKYIRSRYGNASTALNFHNANGWY